MKTLLLLACLGVCSLSVQAEQIYQWVDEEGVLQFSQQPPPPEVNALTRDIEAPTSGNDADAQAAADASAATAAEAEDVRIKQALEQATPAQIRQHNCEKAKQHVQLLKTSDAPVVKIADNQDNAQARVLTAQELEAELKTAEARVKEYCTAPKEASD